MNIHFDDKELFERLKSATIAKCVVGSHMYGTNTEASDIDYLYIYATSENELNSFIKTHHQLQYKEDGIDYNFVSLHNFMNNTLNGDSSINFEVINSDALTGTDLEFLNTYKNSFLTYTIVRSYLGFARRDIKHFFRAETEYDKLKRLKHIVRGYLYSVDMINGCFDFNDCNKRLLSIELNVATNKQLKEYENLISNLRNVLTEKFNGKTLGLAQKFNVEDGIKITKLFTEYCSSESFKNKQNLLKDFDMTMFINSFENWVEY
jgi:predicted nucleotidyltransferase